ncbi:MAG: hypothetical protein RL375_1138 [Pseudomonadota bacterium]|jgi:nicotinamide riboside kinase
MPGFVIALVGAESTGKSTLARDLCRALTTGADTFAAPGTGSPTPRCALVDESLRTFCDRLGRTPTIDEQAGLADEQSRCIAAAAATHDLVVADTTALMTAVYSDIVFSDTRLYPQALGVQRSYGLTLLTALDLPWQADGLQRDGAHVRGPVDRLIRRALTGAGLGWSVVAGQGPHRLSNALAAVHQALRQRPAHQHTPGDRRAEETAGAGAWRHLCTRCGDGECERRLWRIDHQMPDPAPVVVPDPCQRG